MPSLETRIPPPLVLLVVAAAMWWLAQPLGEMPFPRELRLGAATVLAVLGCVILVAGVAAFRRARTTVNPMRPHQASALVEHGIYRHTRNPMYLGDALLLLGWGVYLAAPLAALAGAAAFVLYIDRFQIAAEERALEAAFGADYAAYRTRVRRWL